MTALSQRQKLLGGFFCIVSAAWMVDWYTGGAEPASALASSAQQAVAEAFPLPPDPPDLDAVIESLRNDRPPPAALPIDVAGRDLFTPTARMRAILVPADPTLSAKAASAELREAPPPAFEEIHDLQGVLTGQVPLAVIDGALYRRGAVLEGYRLVELGSDYAVFVRGGSRVTLEVNRGTDR